MPAPTFVAEFEPGWGDSSSPKTTASINVLAGDVLVAFAILEAQATTINVAGGSLTWTLHRSSTAAGATPTFIWSAVVDADKTMTVSLSEAANTNVWWGCNVLLFRGSGGAGASNIAVVNSGAPSLSLTTTQANSAVVVCVGDWNAADGATRTWRTGAGAATEVTYFRNATRYTVYGAYHADAGAVGSKTVGLSAPSGQDYTIAAVEVLGATGGGSSDLVVDSATHSHTATSPTLAQVHALTVDAATHTHTADGVTLGVAAALSVDPATHGHAADSPTLTQSHVLAVDSAMHAHAADAPTITQTHILEVASATHSHSADQVTLAGPGELGVDSPVHAHTAGSPTLTQAHSLTVDSAVHTHTADVVAAAQAHVLTVAPAQHGHTASSVTLAAAGSLTVADTAHAHTADSPPLTQVHVLAVDVAVHAHAADLVTLIDPTIVIPAVLALAAIPDPLTLVALGDPLTLVALED